MSYIVEFFFADNTNRKVTVPYRKPDYSATTFHFHLSLLSQDERRLLKTVLSTSLISIQNENNLFHEDCYLLFRHSARKVSSDFLRQYDFDCEFFYQLLNSLTDEERRQLQGIDCFCKYRNENRRNSNYDEFFHHTKIVVPFN
ncbi:hypothetical protein [Scytonema sp. NUACC26]|uniref:hypothetical protein n=1 Tax=Scytonema sp. NUACC26 TaxID=3140176 RepID=UPI0034DC9A42